MYYFFRFALFLMIPCWVTAQEMHESQRNIKTYPYSDPNPLPAMAINQKVAPFYPYFMIDGYTDIPENQNWKVITLDNGLITVTVLPEVGGKVLGAKEKATQKDFVYENHVMKFRAIGIRGPWTSGGIEHNFGLDLGHAPWAAGAVDYTMLKNPDSSVTCVVGGLDLASRSEWRMKINLPANKGYFETEALWFNPLPLHQAYLSWENAAFKAGDDLRFYFPGNYHIGHDGLASPWPIDAKGRDLSYYNKNNFGGSKSYHVVGDYRNWFGGVYQKDSFGFGHWSSYDDAPGKKLWIWSLSREGAIWEDLLTDSDGQYIEAQSGVTLNQAAEKSGYHSPFRQRSHKPYYSETKTDFWFPVKSGGDMVDANPYGTLSIEKKSDGNLLHITPLQTIDDSLIIVIDNRVSYAKKVSLKPLQLFSVPLQSYQNIEVRVGLKKLYFNNHPVSIVDRPVVANDSISVPDDADQLFRMAEEQNAMRNFTEAETLFSKCIQKSPSNSEALARLAELNYRKGEYEKGLDYARRVLTFSSYDGAANFIYGCLLDKLNQPDKAEEALAVAARVMEFRSAAYAKLASIEMRKQDYLVSADYAKKALDFNRYNLEAWFSLIAAKRKQSLDTDSDIQALLKIDPLSHFAYFEKILTREADTASLTSFRSRIQNEFPHETYLELASHYKDLGLINDAISVLNLAPDHPVVHYWKAWLYRDIDSAQSRNNLGRALAFSPKMIFPFRGEELEIFGWAERQQHSWKNEYYQAIIHWHNNNIEKALSFFKACGDEPDYAGFYAARGIFFQKFFPLKQVEENLKKAIQLDQSEWRFRHALSSFYEDKGFFEKQNEIAQDAYKSFPKNAVISIDYAKALLNSRNPDACLKILSKTLVLPQEGAQEGHEIFENANLFKAAQLVSKKQYRAALKAIAASRKYPEHLGSGMPYDPDQRLQDLMTAFCMRQMGDSTNAIKMEERIASYTTNAEHFVSASQIWANYIGVRQLQRDGKSDLARQLMKQWTRVSDSLAKWEISALKSQPQSRWVAAQLESNFSAAEIIEAENKVLPFSSFTVFLECMRAIGKGKRLTDQ